MTNTSTAMWAQIPAVGILDTPPPPPPPPPPSIPTAGNWAQRQCWLLKVENAFIKFYISNLSETMEIACLFIFFSLNRFDFVILLHVEIPLKKSAYWGPYFPSNRRRDFLENFVKKFRSNIWKKFQCVSAIRSRLASLTRYYRNCPVILINNWILYSS